MPSLLLLSASFYRLWALLYGLLALSLEPNQILLALLHPSALLAPPAFAFSAALCRRCLVDISLSSLLLFLQLCGLIGFPHFFPSVSSASALSHAPFAAFRARWSNLCRYCACHSPGLCCEFRDVQRLPLGETLSLLLSSAPRSLLPLRSYSPSFPRVIPILLTALHFFVLDTTRPSFPCGRRWSSLLPLPFFTHIAAPSGFVLLPRPPPVVVLSTTHDCH